MKPIKEATLTEVCEGLRAQVKGLVPAKPGTSFGGNVVRLPRATKEDMIRQEAGNWQRRMTQRRVSVNALADGTTWPERMAAAELSVEPSFVDTFKCGVEAEGRVWRALDSLDVPTGLNPDADFDSWEDAVCADGEEAGIPLVEQISSLVAPENGTWDRMGEEELLSFLGHHLTVTELRALQDRAAGWKVSSRQTLMRARQKAQRALAETPCGD